MKIPEDNLGASEVLPEELPAMEETAKGSNQDPEHHQGRLEAY